MVLSSLNTDVDLDLDSEAYVPLSAGTLEHPDLKAFYAYWQTMRAARPFPARSDLSPKAMKPFLSHIHMYDVVAGGTDFRNRLVGTALFTGIHDDYTGQHVSDYSDQVLGKKFAFFMRHVLKIRAPVRSVTMRKMSNPLDDRIGETLWLPLGADRQISQIVALTEFRRVGG